MTHVCLNGHRRHLVALGCLSLNQRPVLEVPNDSLDADRRGQGDSWAMSPNKSEIRASESEISLTQSSQVLCQISTQSAFERVPPRAAMEVYPSSSSNLFVVNHARAQTTI